MTQNSLKMPKAPRFSMALLGPGIVLIAMGLGSGEYILWPYLIAQFGFGVIWGAVVGISFQYLVTTEASRYTLATGGSVYFAFYKLNKLIPFWFILSTFLSFAWPGIIISSGIIFSELFGINDFRIPTIIMLLIIGLLLTFGGKVYNNLEKFQKLVIAVSIPMLLVIAFMLTDKDTFSNLSKGILGIGENYKFLPSGISIMGFLGAVAYSGAGGNLILSNSFYIQDEGLGMAKGVTSQIDRKAEHKHVPAGVHFEMNEANKKEFNHWFRLNLIEQFISFWFIGILVIFLLAIIAYELIYPFGGNEGLSFIFLQRDILNTKFGSFIGSSFLFIGFIFLFKTQLGIFETTSRIMTENLQLLSGKITKKYKRSSIFFFFLWAQIFASILITLLNIQQPLSILLIGTFFSAVSMFVLTLLILLLNRSKELAKETRPGLFIQILLLLGSLFYGNICCINNFGYSLDSFCINKSGSIAPTMLHYSLQNQYCTYNFELVENLGAGRIP